MMMMMMKTWIHLFKSQVIKSLRLLHLQSIPFSLYLIWFNFKNLSSIHFVIFILILVSQISLIIKNTITENNHGGLSTDSKNDEARQLIQDFRRDCIQKQSKRLPSSNPDLNAPAPFDRLLYLLERYSDHCQSLNLSPWPIHHLKVSIWIHGDVISLKTRIIPLRKTVRCYITSLESIRIKTIHLFQSHPHDLNLTSSQILKDILASLPITRSTSFTSSLNPHHSISNEDHDHLLGGYHRQSILKLLNHQSGGRSFLLSIS